MATTRNYNEESKDVAERKYAYRFDFDVMHRYIVQTMQPFLRDGNFLELGCYQGDFTSRIAPFFENLSCVDASSDALKVASARFPNSVKFFEGTFENIVLPETYSNIAMVHVLEHLDNPVAVLRRVNDEWLNPTGRFFLVCPNANAPSRQIAVKMGIISHNSAVTPAEAAHGHRVTYSLDTLERDAVSAGLRVIYRTGIFFKALANFQWDKLLETEIISEEYLEGCYQLGQQYPDLCASLFLVCEKGDLPPD